MKQEKRWMAVAVALLVMTAVAASPAVAYNRLERSGTIGLTLFGSYGTMTGATRYGYDFSEGLGYGLTLRYTVHPHISLGLYFQNQSYDAISEIQPPGIDKLVATEVMADLYLYRDRDKDVSQYLVLGIGYYRPELRRSREDILFPSENLVVSAGVGLEIFLRENWGVDISGRAFGYVGDGVADQERGQVPADGNFSIGLQGQVGLMYYLPR